MATIARLEARPFRTGGLGKLPWALPLLLALVAPAISLAQVPRVAGARLTGDGQVPAPRLLFYSLMLGEQPAGVLTWYGMVEPLLEQQQIQAQRQQQIDQLQARLAALRAAQQRTANPRAVPPLTGLPAMSTRVVPGTQPPPRRPAAGFQRYGRPGSPP